MSTDKAGMPAVKRGAEFSKGFLRENPVFVLNLGLCPTLATTVALRDGIGMGIAATFVLLCSNTIIAMVKNLIPAKVRIPCYIVIIATFVTIVEIVMQAFHPQLYKNLGIFVPLIVVNCIILGRAEAFASRKSIGASFMDGLGMGFGFGFALVILAAIREALGSGTLFGYTLAPGYQPAVIMILPPGAFITLGLLMGYFNWRNSRKAARSKNKRR